MFLLILICWILLFIFLVFQKRKRTPSSCEIIDVRRTSNPGLLLTFKTPSNAGTGSSQYNCFFFELTETDSDGAIKSTVFIDDSHKRLDLNTLNLMTKTSNGTIPCYTNNNSLIHSSWLANAKHEGKKLTVKLNMPNIALGVYSPYFKTLTPGLYYKVGIQVENDKGIRNTMAYSDVIQWKDIPGADVPREDVPMNTLVSPTDGQISSYGDAIAYILNQKLRFYIDSEEIIGPHTPSIVFESTNITNIWVVFKLKLLIQNRNNEIDYWIIVLTDIGLYCINYYSEKLKIIKLPDNDPPYDDFFASLKTVHAIRKNRTVAIWDIDPTEFLSRNFKININSPGGKYRNIKGNANRVCAIDINNDKIDCWNPSGTKAPFGKTRTCDGCLDLANQDSYYDFVLSDLTNICALKKNNKITCSDSHLDRLLNTLEDIDTIDTIEDIDTDTIKQEVVIATIEDTIKPGVVIAKNALGEVQIAVATKIFPLLFNTEYPKIIVTSVYTDYPKITTNNGNNGNHGNNGNNGNICFRGVRPGRAEEYIYCIPCDSTRNVLSEFSRRLIVSDNGISDGGSLSEATSYM